MNWTTCGVTLGFMVVGYLFGSISNAVWITKLLKHEDVREKGSGNAGATNVTRNYGKKIGGLVFILDVLKPVIAMIIGWAVNQYAGVDLIIPAIGLAAVIGHIWPIFFKFKGGKGASCMAGYMLAVQWMLFPLGAILFFTTIMITRKVSIGSIFAPLIVITVNIIFGFTLEDQQQWMSPLTANDGYPWWMDTIFMVVIWLLVVVKHHENIKRLLNGTERNIGSKKAGQ